MDVDHVSKVRHHLLSLKRNENYAHAHTGSREGSTEDLASRNSLKNLGPSRMLKFKLYVRRLDVSSIPTLTYTTAAKSGSRDFIIFLVRNDYCEG